MEAMAQLMLKQSVSGLDSDGPTQGDVAGEIRLRELALEEKRMDMEQKKIDAELQMTMKREQMKMELELKVHGGEKIRKGSRGPTITIRKGSGGSAFRKGSRGPT